jgi:hypothetical protein
MLLAVGKDGDPGGNIKNFITGYQQRLSMSCNSQKF